MTEYFTCMALTFKAAVEAGRAAFEMGRAAPHAEATVTSPLAGFFT